MENETITGGTGKWTQLHVKRLCDTLDSYIGGPRARAYAKKKQVISDFFREVDATTRWYRAYTQLRVIRGKEGDRYNHISNSSYDLPDDYSYDTFGLEHGSDSVRFLLRDAEYSILAYRIVNGIFECRGQFEYDDEKGDMVSLHYPGVELEASWLAQKGALLIPRLSDYKDLYERHYKDLYKGEDEDEDKEEDEDVEAW